MWFEVGRSNERVNECGGGGGGGGGKELRQDGGRKISIPVTFDLTPRHSSDVLQL